MNPLKSNINALFSVFSQDTQTLERIVRNYPASSLARMLLAKKYKEENNAAFTQFKEETAFYMGNVPWYLFSLSQSDVMEEDPGEAVSHTDLSVMDEREHNLAEPDGTEIIGHTNIHPEKKLEETEPFESYDSVQEPPMYDKEKLQTEPGTLDTLDIDDTTEGEHSKEPGDQAAGEAFAEDVNTLASSIESTENLTEDSLAASESSFRETTADNSLDPHIEGEKDETQSQPEESNVNTAATGSFIDPDTERLSDNIKSTSDIASVAESEDVLSEKAASAKTPVDTEAELADQEAAARLEETEAQRHAENGTDERHETDDESFAESIGILPADSGTDKISDKDPDEEITDDDADKNIEFEPLHTIDYFASQGIRLREEDLKDDRLSQQVKSFTGWLKSMKQLHPGRLPEQNEVIEKIIQNASEISNVGPDVLTEAMAEVLVKQNKKDKAIEMYQKLSLMNPSKSAYFAAKIENLKTS